MEVTASSNLIVAKHFLVPSPMLSAEYIDNLEGSEKILLVSHSKMGWNFCSEFIWEMFFKFNTPVIDI